LSNPPLSSTRSGTLRSPRDTRRCPSASRKTIVVTLFDFGRKPPPYNKNAILNRSIIYLCERIFCARLSWRRRQWCVYERVMRFVRVYNYSDRTDPYGLARASRTANHRRNLFSSPRRRRRRRRNSAAKFNRISPSSGGQQRDRGTTLCCGWRAARVRCSLSLASGKRATANPRGPATRYADLAGRRRANVREN